MSLRDISIIHNNKKGLFSVPVKSYNASQGNLVKVPIFQINSPNTVINDYVEEAYSIGYTIQNIGNAAGSCEVQLKNTSSVVLNSASYTQNAGDNTTGEFTGTLPSDDDTYTWTLNVMNLSTNTADGTLNITVTTNPLFTWGGDRAIFIGGYVPGTTYTALNTIDYCTISTLSAFSDFGDLTIIRSNCSASSNTVTGIVGGGFYGCITHILPTNLVTISTPGNATVGGNLTTYAYSNTSLSNGTNAIFTGGRQYTGSNTYTYKSSLDTFTFASLSNAVSNGDLTLARVSLGSINNSNKGICIGGSRGGKYYTFYNTLDTFSLVTVSDASALGSLSGVGASISGMSHTTRGVFWLTFTATTTRTLQYMTTATDTTSTLFCSIETPSNARGSACNNTYGMSYFGNSSTASTYYVTIMTPSNATTFSTLTVTRYNAAGASGDAS